MTWDRGVALVEHGLWLDPLTVRDLAFVSHAHSDHSRRHRTAVLTSETLALLPPERRPHRAVEVREGDRFEVAGGVASLHDAGHMLGSAQLLFEHDGRRLLYTGDLKLTRGSGRKPTPIPAADVLVVESTYGRPHFRFPPVDAAAAEVAEWCSRRLRAGVTPVLLAHALGKAQELMLELAPYGFRFALEQRCVPFAEGYAAAGVALPDWVPLDGEPEPDRVVICPPAGKDELRRCLRRYRTALISGWAQDVGFRGVFGADEAFPLSDHCDFEELLEVVRLSGAEQVYTVHGFSEDLARHLRRRGVRAHPLHRTEQLSLLL